MLQQIFAERQLDMVSFQAFVLRDKAGITNPEAWI